MGQLHLVLYSTVSASVGLSHGRAPNQINKIRIKGPEDTRCAHNLEKISSTGCEIPNPQRKHSYTNNAGDVLSLENRTLQIRT